MIELLLNGNNIEIHEDTLPCFEEIIAKCDNYDISSYGANNKCISVPNSCLFGLNPTTAFIHFREEKMILICFVWRFSSERPKLSEIRNRRKNTCHIISNALKMVPTISFPIVGKTRWRFGDITIVHQIFDRFGYEEDVTICFDD